MLALGINFRNEGRLALEILSCNERVFDKGHRELPSGCGIKGGAAPDEMSQTNVLEAL
jgi:hypothetical protein